MSKPMETRESLLLRLSHGRCERAWYEFADIYRPMIVRLAKQSGLQESDADDVAQVVLVSISRTIGSWRKDAKKGRFRAWLTTVTKNAVRNAVTRVPRDKLVGETQLFQLLNDSSSDQDAVNRHIETEFMRAVFRSAARQVRTEFAEATWHAFWRTTVGESSVDECAEELQMSRGAVYTARSRVMRRLQQVTHDITMEVELP
ncbi:MAG: sigma-70 family RNA polymerase sigma factor [Planctomycetales bacterium]|nr:sigma-70 family RNA polymerase sigma factor [Planctomycetales bacterium]MCA9169056.1 sigma-70 family RNA polymerase sigma factor [Planctomycetales bacterium]